MDSNSITDWFGGTQTSNSSPYTYGSTFNSSGYRADPSYYKQLTEGAGIWNQSTGASLSPEEYDKMVNPNNYYTRWIGAGINNLYSTLFNRQADQGGYDYWSNLGNTMDYEQIKSAMMNTPEYQSTHPQPNTQNTTGTTTPYVAPITGTSNPVPTNTSPLVDTSPINSFRPQQTMKFNFQPEYRTQASLIGNFNK